MARILVNPVGGEIAKSWPHIRHLVYKGLERGKGEYEERDILDALLDGSMHLFIGMAGEQPIAIILATITRFPRLKVLTIRFGAAEEGYRDAYLPWIEEVVAWGEKQGCAFPEFHGRPGWKKLLKGWTQTHIVMRKI
jgi:hypothetical protein